MPGRTTANGRFNVPQAGTWNEKTGNLDTSRWLQSGVGSFTIRHLLER
jgi:hypothetical protein